VLIVSDRNIPFVEEVFAELGTVRTLPAAEIDAAAVRDADLLLCRTTIKVGPALLEGSKVRFVATATIGTDHMDLAWLEAQGIKWASAPGSNADSVALWWACALAILGKKTGIDITALRVGVVGVGHVGKRIARLASALGHAPLLCDPPRARAEGAGGFVALDELIARADLISLHVPLTKDGDDATLGFIDAARMDRLRRGSILLNACRGEVVDSAALITASGRGVHAILDVFTGEPTPDPASVAAAVIATPHIAGHSLDGKVNGTDMVYRAACAFLGRTPSIDVRSLLPPIDDAPQRVDSEGKSDAEVLHAALLPHYDLLRDDAALREILTKPQAERGPAFRTYRDRYPIHREPRGTQIIIKPKRTRISALLTELGVR
jgi:erythronate-4-phosphate dehydrogenase